MNSKIRATALEEQFLEKMKELVRPGSKMLLAVSGGSDSLGLMHLASAVAPELNLELAIGFVDHGLRKGIEREYAFVKECAEELSIPVELGAIPIEEAQKAKTSGESIQAWARDRRYKLLTEIAERLGASIVATGHTMDDQAETMLMRLIRGTGIDGLGGIPVRRALSPNLDVLRPLLFASRQKIRVYLTGRNVKWVDDPSNENSRFFRVRIRRELMPLMDEMQSGVARRLAATATDIDTAISLLNRECLDQQKLITRLRLAGGIKVKASHFQALPAGMAGRIIRLAIECVRGNLRAIERVHVDQIEKLIYGNSNTDVIQLPGETIVYVDRSGLFVFPKALPPSPTGSGQPGAIGAGLWQVRFTALGAFAEVRAPNSAHVENLEVRARRPGDRLMGSERRFKEVLSRGRVPRPYRDFVPVLVEGNQVVSCPALVPSRNPEIKVNWVLEQSSPFLDVDFEL
jgi:tRNA(Ile)-lysidine synthase